MASVESSVVVSEKAVIRRINRALYRERYEVLRVNRGEYRREYGKYGIFDINTGNPVAPVISNLDDLAWFAKKLGVMGEHERISE